MANPFRALGDFLFGRARRDDDRTLHCEHQEFGVCWREECQFDDAAERSW
jgi:hypothetical protein